jgi:uncharacterized protein YqhQ
MNQALRVWRHSVQLLTGMFSSVTSGLTEPAPPSDSAPSKKDKNVDMIIGGQAVIEGVMMRSLTGYTVAVRQPNGEIAFKRDRITPVTKKYPILRFPVLRGSVILIQSLILGMRALNFSASVSSEGEEGEPELSNWAIVSSMLMAFAFGVVLFILAPLALTNLIRHYAMPGMDNFTYNLIDGVIRTFFFFAYVLSISLMDDIRRVFQYHGAEHKTVFTFEAHEALTVENAASKSTLHPRCGTSFLLFVMAISILVFSLIPSTAPFMVKFGARIVLIPLIAGLAYEIIRFSARHLTNPVCRVLVRPGMWLQKITTKPPDEKQLEVAVVALKEALLYDEVEENRPAAA